MFCLYSLFPALYSNLYMVSKLYQNDMSIIDRILKPDDLPYDFEAWEKMSFSEQAKLSCQAWYHQGFGSPVSTLFFYVIKLALWLWIFFIFANYSTELSTFATFSEWWAKPEAFGKFIV